MSPEGKQFVNDLLEPYDARVDTPIEPDQDIRFIKITTGGASEDPLNALDHEGLMLHTEDDVQRRLARAKELGKPLLRMLSSFYHGATERNVLHCEDLNSGQDDSDIAPQHTGRAYSRDREPRRPSPLSGQGYASVYPPGHPSLTGTKIR